MRRPALRPRRRPAPPALPAAPRALSQKEIDEVARLSNKTAAAVAEAMKGQPREIAMQVLEGLRRKVAAQQPTTTASAVPEPASAPSDDVDPFSLTARGRIEPLSGEGKGTPAITAYVKGVMKDLGVTNTDEQNVVADLILARALSGSDARNRADALAEIYEQVKAQAGTKSFAAFRGDEGRLREIDATLRRMVGPASSYTEPLASMGRPEGSRRRGAAVRETVEESEQAMRREEGTLLRPNRRAPTLRKPRGSNRFKKVREAQDKQARVAATLPAIRRDLGVVRRRLTLLKGKRTAQAKYARDQLQAEATRLMRRIEKVEGQVERAAAAVARAVKAANPKKKQPKVKPLKQPKAKKPKATRKRKPTRRTR